jgi:hypothetical protein
LCFISHSSNNVKGYSVVLVRKFIYYKIYCRLRLKDYYLSCYVCRLAPSMEFKAAWMSITVSTPPPPPLPRAGTGPASNWMKFLNWQYAKGLKSEPHPGKGTRVCTSSPPTLLSLMKMTAPP